MSWRSNCWRWRTAYFAEAVAVFSVFISACGSGNGKSSPPPFIAVLGAFPAELAPLVEQAAIDETVDIEGRVFRLGTLGGTRVVLGLTGIGLLNAERTTRTVLDRFEVTGVVVSAVAGSFLRIGDVAVPERWTFLEGGELRADAEWIARAEEIAANGNVLLESCTVPPNSTSGGQVCVTHQPIIAVGGLGRSSDPFGGTPFVCQPAGGDVFGCDVAPEESVDESLAPGRGNSFPHNQPEGSQNVRTTVCGQNLPRTDETAPLPRADACSSSDLEPLAAEDMETAAIAREAAARDLPFIAFRAVSDGEGDPLNLPGFPAQFFAYYRLAAHNAAAATVAFLETISER
jgi:nucleoside phosphorylase